MTLAPDALGDRYHVEFYGDDIAWLWVDADDGRVYGMNPENGVFGVAKDTNEKTNPTALESIGDGHRRRSSPTWPTTPTTQEVWWEGMTKNPPADLTGWQDWKGELISERAADDTSPWAHPNSRFTTTLANVPNVAARLRGARPASRSTRSSSAAAPATASRWSARSPTSPRACTTA